MIENTYCGINGCSQVLPEVESDTNSDEYLTFNKRICLFSIMLLQKTHNSMRVPSIISDTPRYIYYLHTLSWMMNMFGIFFILAAHEHYSIDVFVAFYISSRLFLYYHTLSNNQGLMQRDSLRTKVWFPLYSYFESGIEGIVPNEYETPEEIFSNMCQFLKETISEIRTHMMLVAKNSTTNTEMTHSNTRISAANKSKNK